MNSFYELFAGGGMARLGLGPHWRCLFANDFDAKKADAYAQNFKSTHLRVDDVANVTASDLPDRADLLWASFPCQDLSLAGKGVGLCGERSGAFWQVSRLLLELREQDRQPSVVVLENVVGALSSNDGKDFAQIADSLRQNGYRFGAMVLDAVHFVPQSRPRLFIVAVLPEFAMQSRLERSGPCVHWHPNRLVEAKLSLPKSCQESWIWWNLPSPPKRTQVFADLIDTESPSIAWHTAEETQRLLDMMSPVNREKVSVAQRSGKLYVGGIYRRTRLGVQRAEVRFDDVAGCLRTASGGSSRQSILVVNGSKVRSRLLATREAARLMGLPETYSLPVNYNEAYSLAGDGLVVPVVRFLSRHLLTPLASQSVRLSVAA
jgi:DNA (cytosine-5)-methyltransferase 1